MTFTNDLDLVIGYDHGVSSEINPVYCVYDISGTVIYRGSYTQCLVVIGAMGIDATMTLKQINEKCNGFLFE